MPETPPLTAQTDIKPVYALVGAEPYLQVRELRALLAQFGGDVDRVDVDGERAELSDVLDDLRCFAMFGGRKVVVVRDADEFISRNRPAMEAYVERPSDSGTLVLRVNSLPANQRIHKMIAKVGRIIPCEPPKKGMVAPWIVSHAKVAHGATVTPPAANMLAELIGDDLGRIDSELGKLALMAPDGKITPETVSGAVAFQREQAMWDLTDTLSTGDVAAAVKRWRQLLQTDPSSEFRAVTWLTLWLGKLGRARAMAAARTPPGVITKELKIWPADKLDGMLRFGARLGDEGIRRAVARLADADRAGKSGVGDATTNVEAFLLSLAR